MGRANNTNHTAGAELRSEGEIDSLADSPLHVGNIADFAGVAASSEPQSYDDDADELAIGHIIANLRKQPRFRSASGEALRDNAETLYALCCRKVQAGAGGEQLAKIAALLGEQPAALQSRLS